MLTKISKNFSDIDVKWCPLAISVKDLDHQESIWAHKISQNAVNSVKHFHWESDDWNHITSLVCKTDITIIIIFCSCLNCLFLFLSVY